MRVTSLVASLAVLVAASATLLPASSLFAPSWLHQRSARHLVAQPYFVPPYSASYQDHFSPRTLSVYPGRTQAYLVQPQVLAPFHWTARPYYQQAPVMHYLTPVHSQSPFAKRVDVAEKQPESSVAGADYKSKTPCLLQAAQSENYPVYVLPPKNFQPIVYHQQAPLTGYLNSVPVVYQDTSATADNNNKVKSAEELWYDSESSEGKVKTEDNEINGLSASRKKIVYVPVVDGGYTQFPVYEAVIQQEKLIEASATKKPSKPYEGSNWYNTKPSRTEPATKDSRRYKTKLPVGLTSFFLGGIRGVSGRHWNMPGSLVKQLEFMPNISPMSPENKYLPEEGYIKPVESEPTAAAIPGDPEKDESQETQKTASGESTKTSEHNHQHNTIIDSPIDLEAQESSQSGASTTVVEVPRRDGTKKE